MEAMDEIQAKGDLMMKTIKDQKNVLNNITKEIDEAHKRLDQAKRLESEAEKRRKDTMKEIVMYEENTEKLVAQKAKLELDVQILEKSKISKEEKLENMEKEIKEISNRQIELDNTEMRLKKNREKLVKLQEKIDASSSLLR